MMNITKDEARVLAYALKEFRYSEAFKMTKEHVTALTYLEHRLEENSKDKRLVSRHKSNDWKELLDRISYKYFHKNP